MRVRTASVRRSAAASAQLTRRRTRSRPPTVLTIAGSDSAGAAGIQADLKTFAALACHGLTALTAVTAQDSRRVAGVLRVPPSFVSRQIETLLADIGADAVKIGMLGDPASARAVARALGRRRVPLVVDPVLRASTGGVLTPEQAARSIRRHLLPLATLVTPNLPEAEALLGRSIRSPRAMEDAGRSLVALGARAALLKGGHSAQPGRDLFAYREHAAIRIRWIEAPRVDTRNTRGTGCVLSAACACFLARGVPVAAAVARAKRFLTRALAAGRRDRFCGAPAPVALSIQPGFRKETS
jgi:hydroxymethylpyrimidine/phosphomethylpyrimidine kinase